MVDTYVGGRPADQGRGRVLAVICLAIVLSLATWFSATSVMPELQRRFEIPDAILPWITNGVQLGFVVGAVAMTMLNLSDRVRPNLLIAVSASMASLSNASLFLASSVPAIAISRGMTGAALAGVYPPALKLVSAWFAKDRGLALGAVVGALTIGSALPHLIQALVGGSDWRIVVALASFSGFVGAILFLIYGKEGPLSVAPSAFDSSLIGSVISDRALLLVNLGYFGHMWELYAAWGWFLAFVIEARKSLPEVMSPPLVTFSFIASGAIGCIAGGFLSDRIGRTATTILMMGLSGSFASLMGFAVQGSTAAFLLVTFGWGVTIVGDSAQFSAAATELSQKKMIGTALTLQLGIGFAISMAAIWLTPMFAHIVGWRWAFLMLVPGPIVGIASMLALRMHPASWRLAGGLR